MKLMRKQSVARNSADMKLLDGHKGKIFLASYVKSKFQTFFWFRCNLVRESISLTESVEL